MIYLKYPSIFNCLFWSWYRFRVRPFLLIRKRGFKGWRLRGGIIAKRRGTHGFWCHRFWMSQGGHRFWGYAPVEGKRITLWASLHAFGYEGIIKEEREDSQRFRPHRVREFGRFVKESKATEKFNRLKGL